MEINVLVPVINAYKCQCHNNEQTSSNLLKTNEFHYSFPEHCSALCFYRYIEYGYGCRTTFGEEREKENERDNTYFPRPLDFGFYIRLKALAFWCRNIVTC